jgi:hypothetical protein
MHLYSIAALAQSLEQLAPKAASELASTVLYFGSPVKFSPDIAAESQIPARELKLVYKFMGDEKIEMQYVPNAGGTPIPGYARKVDIEVLRQKNSEKLVLWKRTFEVQQTPADFSIQNVSLEAQSKGKSQKLGEYSFSVKNIKVNFAKPVDASGEKVITALVDDLQIGEPSIDAAATRLECESSGKTDVAVNGALKPENITCSSFFNDGVLLLNVVLQKLPKTSLKGKTLRGVLGVRLNVVLLNRRASRSATTEETLRIPISLTL